MLNNKQINNKTQCGCKFKSWKNNIGENSSLGSSKGSELHRNTENGAKTEWTFSKLWKIVKGL